MPIGVMLCANDVYARSPLREEARRQEETMSFVVWIIPGLATGFTTGQLTNKVLNAGFLSLRFIAFNDLSAWSAR
jgi:hypothetical protein